MVSPKARTRKASTHACKFLEEQNQASLFAQSALSQIMSMAATTMGASSQIGMYRARGHRAHRCPPHALARHQGALLCTDLPASAASDPLVTLHAPCEHRAHAHARFGLEADPATAARSRSSS